MLGVVELVDTKGCGPFGLNAIAGSNPVTQPYLKI